MTHATCNDVQTLVPLLCVILNMVETGQLSLCTFLGCLYSDNYLRPTAIPPNQCTSATAEQCGRVLTFGELFQGLALCDVLSQGLDIEALLVVDGTKSI